MSWSGTGTPISGDTSLWSATLTSILNSIVALYRRATGNVNPTWQEKEIIKASINEALHRACMSASIEEARFVEDDVELTTVSGQNYVDLSAGIFSILDGTLRIESYGFLSPMSYERLIESDPDESLSGPPERYALTDSGSQGVYRVKLSPVPDGIYTIKLTVRSLVEEDGVDSIPHWLTGPLTDLATSIAMRRLSFGNYLIYEDAYRRVEADMRRWAGHDRPRYIARGWV